MDRIVLGGLALLVALAFSLGGCVGIHPEVQIPPVTNGLVATYLFIGSPSGYGFGTGHEMVDAQGVPLFPTSTGGGNLVVSVVGPMDVITPNGLIERGSEFRYDYVAMDGTRTFVGKQIFVPGKGVVGDVSDGVQTTSAGSALVWIHGWGLHGPDFLLASNVAGATHRGGTLKAPIPAENRTDEFSLKVKSGELRLHKGYPDGGFLNATWTPACPLPKEFLNYGRSGLVMFLRLRSCKAGGGGDIGPPAGSASVPLAALAKPVQPGPGPWFRGDSIGGPDAATAWSTLTKSAEYATACPAGCDLYSATRSEATKDVPGAVPLVTSRQHVNQWGFTVWDGSGGHRFVVEFRDAGPAVIDGGSTRIDRPERPHAIGDSAVGATIARVAARFGPTVVRYDLQPASPGHWFIGMAAGEVDQASGEPNASSLLAWNAPDGVLSSFPWKDPDL